jgi:hypothetical protein
MKVGECISYSLSYPSVSTTFRWYTVVTNEVLVTKSQGYNCFISTKEIIYQLVCPESFKGGSPTTALASFCLATAWKDLNLYCTGIGDLNPCTIGLPATLQLWGQFSGMLLLNHVEDKTYSKQGLTVFKSWTKKCQDSTHVNLQLEMEEFTQFYTFKCM